MGNGIGKACHCFAGDGEISKRHNDVGMVLSDPPDEGLGHAFCYVRPDPPRLSYSSSNSDEDTQARDSFATTAFRSISGASVSANTSTPLSTCLADLIGSYVVDRAASFASSTSFASIPLQPLRRCSTCELVPGSGPIERGFMSGPMERGFVSGPIDSSPIEKAAREQLPIENIVKSKKRRRWFNNFKKLISGTIAFGHKPVVAQVKGGVNASDSGDSGGCIHMKDGEYFKDRKSLQWAQGKAGEDRVQVVISEEHGWVFVGIYDGFNGPDATEYLISNLYSAVHRELKSNESQSRNFDEENEIPGHGETMDLDSNSKRKQSNSSKHKRNAESDGERSNHSEVLNALSEALRKTEDDFLDIADKMVRNNPELALIGSCVLVMLMKGEDVYLMNVGDSRAVLAQEAELDDLRPRKVHQDSKRINEEILSNQNFYFGVACGEVPNLIPLQLTTDHSTYVEEEVERIRNDHSDDASAVVNERVKGYLKVTRAFGVGFLKQPKLNEALLEMFRINYVGSSPYITCLPSLYHLRLGPRDRFLILSSDGLYQYFTNEEAVFHVESFIASFPEGDPAQHLIEEVLFRAAKKFGIDFYELLDIPQGERRRYHDDVSIIIISLEGRIWRSSM